AVADRFDAARIRERRHVPQHTAAREVDGDEPRLEIGGDERDPAPLCERLRRKDEACGSHQECAAIHTLYTGANEAGVRLPKTKPMAVDRERQLLETAKDRLEQYGWTISLESFGGYFGLQLEHPLTTARGVFFDTNATYDESLVFLEKTLSRREFDMIAKRPRDMPHASLVGRFRQAAQANRWTSDVLAIVARVLRHEAVLTHEESAWLELAGPAW